MFVGSAKKTDVVNCSYYLRIDGDGDHNSLVSKTYKIFDYFRTVVPYFEFRI